MIGFLAGALAIFIAALWAKQMLGGPRATWFWNLERRGIPDHYLRRPEQAFARWGRRRALTAWAAVTEPEHRRKRDYPARDWEWRRLAVRERDGERCVVCGRGDLPHDGLHTHHREPFGTGGSHALENLQLLCGDCHAEEHLRLEREEAIRSRRGSPRDSRSHPSHRSGGGNCIRCRASIPQDPGRPYCLECFRVWDLWRNWDYVERYCHHCGDEMRSSRRRPLCDPCYRDLRS